MHQFNLKLAYAKSNLHGFHFLKVKYLGTMQIMAAEESKEALVTVLTAVSKCML